MKRSITYAAFMLMLFSSCAETGTQSSNNISNDEYDLAYMANKEFDRLDCNLDQVITPADAEAADNNYTKIAVNQTLSKMGGDSIERAAYTKEYQIPITEVDAEVSRNILYKSVGERRLMMDIYRPKGLSESKIPVAMFLHGGGWFAGDKYIAARGSHGMVLNQLLESGIAVAAVNYSLVNDRDIHVEDCVSDVKDALAYLNREADSLMLDRDNMVVWGGSAGAHLTMMLGFTDLEEFPGDEELFSYRMKPASLVSWYGAGSFEVADSENLESEMKELERFHLRFTDSSDWNVRRAKAAQVSPVRYIDSEDPSIILMNGDLDVIVEVEQTYLLDDVLKANDVEHRVVVVKNSGHSWMGTDMNPDLEGICKITADYIIEKIGK